MPNWCYTHYTVEGNKNDIEQFRNNLDIWTSTEGLPNGFGNNWLGNICHKAGLKKELAPNCPDNVRIKCRGSLSDLSEVEHIQGDRYSFTFATETAWYTMSKIFFAIIDKFHYDVQIAYQAEECGMDIYDIYDPHGLGYYDSANIYLDVYLDDEDEIGKYPILKELQGESYFNSMEFEDKLSKYGFNSIEQFNAYFHKTLTDDSYVAAHEFEYIDEVYD